MSERTCERAGGAAARTPPALEFYLGAVVDLKGPPPCVAPSRSFKQDRKWHFPLPRRPTLVRKWLAKMIKMAFFSKMTKMTKKARLHKIAVYGAIEAVPFVLGGP